MNLKKSVNIFGKVVPVWAIVTLSMVGIGSAALLTYYGTITATVVVQQSIVLEGNPVTESVAFAAGSSMTCGDQHKLINHADVPIDVAFASIVDYPDNGVTTSYQYYDGAAWSPFVSPGTFSSGDTYIKVCYGSVAATPPGTYTITTTAIPV